MIGPILAVTMTVTALGPVEEAYSKYLGYEVVERGKVDKASATVWNAPSVAGHDYIVMRPQSKSPHYIRFVVTGDYPNYKPFRTYGWNAAELLVQDVDATAEKLKDSPFEIVGAPENIKGTLAPRAMQVIGPAKEVLYLTKSKTLGPAESPVDRYFIVIDGARSVNALLDFFGGLGAKVSLTGPARLGVLNRALGIDSETEHLFGIARLTGPFLLELDQFPDAVKDRPVRRGDLPPGIAIVTMATDSIAAAPHKLLAPAASLKGMVSHGDRTAVIKGPSGELIELVERALEPAPGSASR